MAETARRLSSSLGADAARRLIARPIRLQTAQTARPIAPRGIETVTGAPLGHTGPAPGLDLARRLEAEILVMKAVLAAERRENEKLRSFVHLEDEDLSDEARSVRDRWSGLVDRLLQD